MAGRNGARAGGSPARAAPVVRKVESFYVVVLEVSMPRKTRGFDCYGWWINDWRGSVSFSEMTLAEQGAYRNLCEMQFALAGRGTEGVPNDDEELARFAGCTLCSWLRVKNRVLAEFESIDGRLVNSKVVDEVQYLQGKIAGGLTKSKKPNGKQKVQQRVVQKGMQKGQQKGVPSSSSSGRR